MKEQLGYSENLTPLLSWIHLIDVHQNVVFEMEKNRWRARVTDNRCNKLFISATGLHSEDDFRSGVLDCKQSLQSQSSRPLQSRKRVEQLGCLYAAQ